MLATWLTTFGRAWTTLGIACFMGAWSFFFETAFVTCLVGAITTGLVTAGRLEGEVVTGAGLGAGVEPERGGLGCGGAGLLAGGGSRLGKVGV